MISAQTRSAFVARKTATHFSGSCASDDEVPASFLHDGFMADYDLAIIGGGLNGVSIARDAAGRGLRVVLLEQGDLGGAASSATPRLIHGDLAVLERRGFR